MGDTILETDITGNLSNHRTVRDIIILLKKRSHIALDELAKELGISKPAVLKHINKLESRGIIERRFIIKGRGRPRCYIKLTDKADDLFPKKYDEWSIDIAKYAEKELGRSRLLKFLKSRFREQFDKYNLYVYTEKNIRSKVSRLTNIMNKEGYLAEVRETKDYIEIVKYNCPIIKITKLYPELCSFEANILSDMLDRRVELIASIVNNGSSCVFRIFRN